MELFFLLFFVVAVITVSGHLIWIGIAAALRWGLNPEPPPAPHVPDDDLAATERQLILFYQDGKINDEIYEHLMARIRAERAGPTPPAAAPKIPDEIVVEPVPSVATPEPEPAPAPEPEPEKFIPPPPPRPPRRPFSEVLNSFMEESNIRWGEIIGGLLIIGCSTALVVSLWAQISQIPVLKFLIFTTVTAVLFGIGLYTEHRWKLPTTSRGILTIATLLVPLNFLAIAAVSASTTPGSLVIASELAAPAIFLCLVYFAGRVITPGCAHILAAGVLGSSIGQLLVRHFAEADTSPAVLILLAAFPMLFYVVTVGLALQIVLSDREIDESETTTIFTILGAMSFAALLPFSLLLYKAGPLSLTMMYLAPIVTLWGLPMLATGTVLWRQIDNPNLVASRTAGTALGLLGVAVVLAGMILAWPNPASIVPAALFNFAIFTALALALRLPAAHFIAANCLALAYLVLYHVLAGQVPWQNLRVMSLLEATLTVSSGQALAAAFVGFLIASEWLRKRRRARDGYYYLLAACLIAAVSLLAVMVFGFWSTAYHSLWFVFGIYSLGAFWIAWRHKLEPFSWIGSGLLLIALSEGLGRTLSFSFPWQTALLLHATVCALAAIAGSRYLKSEILSKPLYYTALISLALAVLSLFQANAWEVTSMQAQRVFWISGILLLLLWSNRIRVLFDAFQIALVCAVVLTVKAALQQYEWYSYLPHAFLHPSALQIYGTVLALLCLAWLVLRFLARRALREEAEEGWLHDAWRLLNSNYPIDRLVSWSLLGAFLLLVVYGSLSGITQELAGWGSGYPGFNIAGFPHEEALALGSWIVFGLLAVLMLGNFWERRRGVYLLGALAVFSAAVPLLAGRFEPEVATATAWRWLAAVFLLCGSIVIWYRGPIWRWLEGFGWPRLETGREELSRRMRILLIVVTVVPLLLLTVYPALRAIWYLPVQGPIAGFFARLGDDLSYGGPLVLVALVMIGYAVRERIPDYGFYGGACINATVTLAFLLAVVTAGGLMDRVVLVRLVQLNAITFAIYSWPWLSMRRLWRQRLNEADARLADKLLDLQVSLAIALNAALILPVAVGLVIEPERAGIGTIAVGSFLGWLALATTIVAATWSARAGIRWFSPIMVAAGLLGISCLLAFSVSNIGGGWRGLQVMTVCVTLTAWLMLAAADLTAARLPRGVFEIDEHWRARCLQLAAIVGAVAAFLALNVSKSRWWSVAPLLALSALFAALNWRTLRRRYIYAAGVLWQFAVSIWCIHILAPRPFPNYFFLTNLIVGSLAGIVWLWLELRSRALRDSETPDGNIFSFHNVLAIGWFSLFVLVVLTSFGPEGYGSPLLHFPVMYWVGFGALLALMTACLWDKHAKYAVAGLYLLGLTAGAMALHQLQLTAPRLTWSTTIFLAIYTVGVALVWRERERFIAYAQRFGAPRRIPADATQLKWLSVVTILTTVLVITLAYWIDIRFLSFGLRSTAALAVIAQFVTLGLLAEGTWEHRWQRVAIAVLVLGMVLFGWSWLTPGVDGTWLNRSVILMLLAFGLTAFYGLLLKQARAYSPAWTSAVRDAVPWVLSAGVVALFFCLGTEIFYQVKFGAVRIHPVSLAAIGITLAAAIVISVLFALSPQHDPLRLSERGRMKYVYAAEVMLALLFLHIRLTLPWLFTGFIERYWPLAVMVIAYLGVVTSEALRRRKLLVLAQPLERTGVFLPLLPVLGFWLASSEVDFSLVLFMIGGLYGLLSILRHSFVFGLLAAVSGNAALWYMLHRTDDYQFLQHPQLWLIPVALSALLAAYLNKDKLTDDQMASVRYLSLVAIYVSSTADIFINGVANSPWLPLILGSFSLAGVFAGIIFRIRGLLLLGAIFLLLSIVTMIWYASANLGWTWLWYVAGIVTGATIIFMFAVFEKKRNEVLRLVEGLKEWER